MRGTDKIILLRYEASSRNEIIERHLVLPKRRLQTSTSEILVTVSLLSEGLTSPTPWDTRNPEKHQDFHIEPCRPRASLPGQYRAMPYPNARKVTTPQNKAETDPKYAFFLMNALI